MERGRGWWLASDGRWYPPELRPPALQPVWAPSRTHPLVVVLTVVSVLVVLGAAGCVALLAGAERVERVAGVPDTAEVSLVEFEAVEVGMSLAEVEALFGGPGRLMSTASVMGSEAGTFVWDGRGSLGANVIVVFSDGVVVSKAQFGLR